MNAIANMASHGTTASATAAKNINAPQIAVTGTYLYETFVVPSKEENTRMAMVERLTKQVDTTSWNKACKEMVSLAEEKGETEEAKKSSKLSASATASVLRMVYGAIRNAGPEFSALGYKQGVTGFKTAGLLARKALQSKGVHWTGIPVKTVEQKDAEKAASLAKAAQEQAMQDNPQNVGESYRDWMLRILDVTDVLVDQEKESQKQKHIAKLADKVLELCGDDLDAVMLNLAQRSDEFDESRADESTEQHDPV